LLLFFVEKSNHQQQALFRFWFPEMYGKIKCEKYSSTGFENKQKKSLVCLLLRRDLRVNQKCSFVFNRHVGIFWLAMLVQTRIQLFLNAFFDPGKQEQQQTILDIKSYRLIKYTFTIS
jgi:hypothetical protein